MLKVTIDRSKWDVPESRVSDAMGFSRGGRLLAENGRMCCLGHVGVACGVPLEDMKGKGMPSAVPNPAWPEGLFRPVCLGDNVAGRRHNSGTAEALAGTNDLTCPQRVMRNALEYERWKAERERNIIELGATIGIEFEFTGTI